MLRLLAASAVLVDHSFGMVSHAEPRIPLTREPIGDVAVLVFFGISGYLITQSWTREPRLVAFAAKRMLRIMPALAVVVLVTAYVIGPLTSSQEAGDYLTSRAPAHNVVSHTLLISQLTPPGHWVSSARPPHLPGVFTDTPLPYANGSLWTLSVEVWAYFFVALGGILFLRWRNSVWRIWPCLLLALGIAVTVRSGGGTTYPLFLCFAGGAALFWLRDRIPLSWPLALTAAATWIASYQLPLAAHNLVAGAAVPYLVIFFAFRGLGWLRPLTKPGDLSYGIYVWAWPVQQMVIHLTGTRDPFVVLAVAAPITYLLGLASWHAIERPALRLKRRLPQAGVSELTVKDLRTA
ncbi:MAG TPA: acyltransferase [Thermoleophilaceae bacterium]|nr:acyltransferase [Thermoleophilaceae bacterium]